MTITLTVEEVKNYVSARDDWALARSREMAEQLAQPYHLSANSMSERRAMMDSWDAMNPKPRLLNSVLGDFPKKPTEQKPTTK